MLFWASETCGWPVVALSPASAASAEGPTGMSETGNAAKTGQAAVKHQINL